MVSWVVLRGIRLVIYASKASRYTREKWLVRILGHLEHVLHWDIRTGPQGPGDKVVGRMQRSTVRVCVNYSRHVVRGGLLSHDLQRRSVASPVGRLAQHHGLGQPEARHPPIDLRVGHGWQWEVSKQYFAQIYERGRLSRRARLTAALRSTGPGLCC